ncbi:MAG TPA: hypothetical protein ENL13_01610 [Thermoplasmatales archaeon]|nr:hypothetical protein [Thermoplasmatales archaeon]
MIMLYYIHGYQSNPNSRKGILFKEKLGVVPIKYRDCKPEDLVINDCLDRIKKTVENDKNITLIGSSLGGYLAAETAYELPTVEHIILLNPAVFPPDTPADQIGLPPRIAEEMRDKKLYEEKIPAKVTILMATDDEVIPKKWVIDFAIAQEAAILFLHDDHRFTRNLEKLPSIIKETTKTGLI